jgi:hypothetical protein
MIQLVPFQRSVRVPETIMQKFAEVQEMPPLRSPAFFGRGVGVIVHFRPSHRSARRTAFASRSW